MSVSRRGLIVSCPSYAGQSYMLSEIRVFCCIGQNCKFIELIFLLGDLTLVIQYVLFRTYYFVVFQLVTCSGRALTEERPVKSSKSIFL